MRIMVARMKNCGLILSMLVCACILLLSQPVSILADKGIVSIGVTEVYEPGQKAIIGWDGEREVMILATDVYADEDTIALEIFPLPSQPDRIEKGEFDSFIRLAELIRKEYKPPDHWWDCAHEGEEKGPGVEIVFHEKIGAHDIWVVKANDAAEFAEWAEDFLARNGIDYEIFPQEQRPEDFVAFQPATVPSPLERMVGDYIQEGIDFFVFDLIEISPDPRSVEPIVYQFKTDYLYYPLKISSIIPGYTEIRLFLLTPKPLDPEHLPENELGGIRVAQADGKQIQFALDTEELESIDPRLEELLGGPAWLTALESYDPRYREEYYRTFPIPLSSLDEDVKITEASFTEPPESHTPIWGWTVLGLVVLALGGLLYFRYRRGAQLRRMEREYRKRAWERMQQR
jgi:hypothetical protein